MNILESMEDERLFGPWFQGPSWAGWKAFLAALFALPMTDEQLAIYQKHTQRQSAPSEPAREAWVLVGRRGGKSIIAALLSVFLSVFRDHSAFLGPGEVCTGMVVSPDRKQSRVIRRFERGFCRSIDLIAPMIVNTTKDSLELSNRTILEVMTASDKFLRGYTSHIICNDEGCYLPTDEFADADVEVIAAERPCLATIPDSLLLSISSPASRRGAMYQAHEAFFGKDSAPALCWNADSLSMNPLLDPRVVAEAFERDPTIAASEYGQDGFVQFRSDVETFLTLEAIERSVNRDRPEVLEAA